MRAQAAISDGTDSLAGSFYLVNFFSIHQVARKPICFKSITKGSAQGGSDDWSTEGVERRTLKSCGGGG